MYITQSLKHSAQVNGNKQASVCGQRSQTYKELLERVSRFASALIDSGVAVNDRIAILALNSDRYLEYFFAVPWAGAAVVPLNIRWSVEENTFAVQDAGVKYILVDDTFIPAVTAIQSKCDNLQAIYIGDGETPDSMLNYEALVADNMPIKDALRCDDDLAAILYTGGTTGTPKGVELSHRSFACTAMSVSLDLDFNQPDIRYLHAAPMFHMADCGMTFANTLMGNTHIFMPAFNPDAILKVIEQYQVTDVLLVPTMIGMMLNSPTLNDADVSSLRKIIYGASPMPEGILRGALKQWPDIQFYQGYAQTELNLVGTVLRPEYHVLEGPDSGKLKATGQPSTICEMQIWDENNLSLAAKEVGQIVVRGPSVMSGYWNNPEQTAETIIDGWVKTGDAGYLDEDGFLFLVDRVKDMIVSGGENVFSAEVESCLSLHPKVAEVAVIGIPDPQWGEAVHAIVRLKTGDESTETELIEHCKAVIAGYKCPRSISFREEDFPITGAGKVRKVDLKKQFWLGQERTIG